MTATRDRAVRLADQASLECACAGLRRASRAISKLYESALAPFDLTATQFTMLVALRLRGTLPLSRLAERLGLDRTSLYRAVRPLERWGTLAIRGGHTPRELVAELTPEGRRLIEEALPVWEETQHRFVAALGPRSWEALEHRREKGASHVRATSGARLAMSATCSRRPTASTMVVARCGSTMDRV
jgi:DNA-binding MarR family transcriptional regulator